MRPNNIPILSNAVSVFLLDLNAEEPQVLLMRRAHTLLGAWCQVAGKVEPNETGWEAALREVKEETGLVLTELWSADLCEEFYVPEKNIIQKLPVFVSFISSETPITINEEHDAYQWFSFDDAMELFSFPGQRRVLEYLHSEFVARKASPHLRIDLSGRRDIAATDIEETTG
ncbi:NUDIX hydrolase [Pseudovibrio brasiliensis]|uniref:NUDIX domain-containing protein n=1 Tax=Pseudovibrio brasiliensis TaxID=1898042 RepID=A0ABX8AXC4_9HYPH|nr:NUDIX domain-containing protein [Pseudovibrio brasiliensis]QUS58401.1 NUDIX domain-containing protein [Pseudovibrio brasiliensis]